MSISGEDAPYFEQALRGAMRAVTDGLEPDPLATDGLRRRARLWRATSAVAVAVATAGVVAAAAVLPGARSLFPVEPAGGAAGGPAVVTLTETSAPATAAPTLASASAAPAPAAATSEPASGGPAAAAASTSPPDDDRTTGPARGRDPRETGEPGERGPDARATECTVVPDGSEQVRRLVLDTARDRLRPRWADLSAGGWALDDVPDVALEGWFDLDDVVDAVERHDIVDCDGELRLASRTGGDTGDDLDEVVVREVDAALAGELRDGRPDRAPGGA